ncbi:MAG: hypothetical protein ACRCY9_11440 [Phycicoccus sp.]
MDTEIVNHPLIDAQLEALDDAAVLSSEVDTALGAVATSLLIEATRTIETAEAHVTTVGGYHAVGTRVREAIVVVPVPSGGLRLVSHMLASNSELETRSKAHPGSMNSPSHILVVASVVSRADVEFVASILQESQGAASTLLCLQVEPDVLGDLASAGIRRSIAYIPASEHGQSQLLSVAQHA